MKRKASGVFRTMVLALFLIVILSPRAFAYLDPGSGSYFYQMLMALLLALPFSVTVFWKKIRDFFRKQFQRKKTGPL